MHAADDRPEFAPPPQPGLVRAFVLAVFAHLLLVLALMQGLHWQRESENAVAEAELWAAVPQQAAPREVPAPPPAPTAPPPPVVRAPPKPEPPARRDADIALERENQRKEQAKQRQAELQEKREQERRRLEAQKKRDEELAQKKQEQQKVAEAKRREDEKERKEEEKEKQRKELEKRKEQEVREAKLREKIREENLKRSLAMAGTGAPSSTGTAAQSSGPSASWGAKVQARVRPNIVFTDTVSGNPKAEVEVRTSPDGTIVAKKLVRSSGNNAWDEAVLRALDRTESLPRDTDGRVPSPVVIEFRPKG
jgi:colicin import membrane protein